MRTSKKAEVKFRFKVGDVVSAQGAKLKIVKRFVGPDGGPAYGAVSPHTTGEPWFISEGWLATTRKVRVRKAASK